MWKVIISGVIIGCLVVAGIGSYYAVQKQREAYKEEQKEKEENQNKENTQDNQNVENLSLFFKLKVKF